MKEKHLIITIIGILLFLYSHDLRASHIELVFVWILGIVISIPKIKYGTGFKGRNE